MGRMAFINYIIIDMGFLDFIFDLLDDSTSNSYIETSKLWFERVWNSLRYPYGGKGILIIQDGKLYKRFYIEYNNELSYTISDENDSGCELQYVRLTQEQKDEILRNGYIVLKRYR